VHNVIVRHVVVIKVPNYFDQIPPVIGSAELLWSFMNQTSTLFIHSEMMDGERGGDVVVVRNKTKEQT